MMKRFVALCVLVLLGLARLGGAAERINQEGRILGPLPVLTKAILFNTTNADAVVSAMQIFPVTNPWNEDISRRPVLTNSDAMIAQISADLASSRRTVRLFQEMNFVLVAHVILTWQGRVPPFVVQQAGELPTTSWNSVATTSLQSAILPIANKMEVFRVGSP